MGADATKNLVSRRTFQSGEAIFREGEPSDRAYVIEDGKIEIATTKGGARKKLRILDKGAMFGELALIEAQPRIAEAVALCDTTCMIISREQLLEKINKADPFVQKLVRILVRNLRAAYAEGS